MSAECNDCGRDLDWDFKCAACICGRKLEIAVEALKEIRAERKSFGACPSVADQALKKIAHFTAEDK